MLKCASVYVEAATREDMWVCSVVTVAVPRLGLCRRRRRRREHGKLNLGNLYDYYTPAHVYAL